MRFRYYSCVRRHCKLERYEAGMLPRIDLNGGWRGSRAFYWLSASEAKPSVICAISGPQ